MKLLKLCFVLSAALLFSSYSFGCVGRKVFRSTDSKKESKQNEPQPTQLSSSEEIEKRIDLLKRVWAKCFGDRRYLEEELALLEAQLAEAHKKEKKEKDVMRISIRDFICAPWAFLEENKP